MIRRIKKYFPWLLILLLIWYIWDHREQWLKQKIIAERPLAQSNTMILGKIEALGKLELVKYNFQEVTELTELGKEYFKIFKVEPDSKAVLISQGEAVGCLDLTKMKVQDLSVMQDTIYIKLPEPELCYYKLNLDKTHIYSVQTGVFTDRDKFIERAYRKAEQNIKEAALSSGMMEQTRNNAHLLLKPMLEEMTGKVVIIRETPPPVRLERVR